MKWLLRNLGKIQCAEYLCVILEIGIFNTLTWRQLCRSLYTFLYQTSFSPSQ